MERVETITMQQELYRSSCRFHPGFPLVEGTSPSLEKVTYFGGR